MTLEPNALNLGAFNTFIHDMIPFFHEQPLSYVDVGALDGDAFFSVMNSKLPMRESLLVETNPSSITELQKKIDLIGKEKRVHLHQYAVGATEGHDVIKAAGSPNESAKTIDDEAMDDFSAPIKTLDNLVQEMSSKRISILKIDAKSSKIDVLEGATNLLSKEDIDVIFIEAGAGLSNNEPAHYREIEDFLQKYNYYIFRFYEHVTERTKDAALPKSTHIAFMSANFAHQNSNALSLELFKTKELLKKTRAELENNKIEPNASLENISTPPPLDRIEIGAEEKPSTKFIKPVSVLSFFKKFIGSKGNLTKPYLNRPTSQLKRLIFLVPDLSTTGGIQSRTRMVVTGSIQRSVEYICVSYRRSNFQHISGNIVYEDAPDELIHLLNTWDPLDTAIVFPNNTMRHFPKRIRKEFNRFPLIFNGSGQLAYMLQDSTIIFDSEYVNNLKVTKHVLLSFMDQMTYSQLGIYNHILGFNPVKSRAKNTFDTNQNKYFGYIGRIDFYAKGAERLVEIAIALRDLKLGPLKVFTASNPKNSPQIDAFYALIEERGVKDDIDIIIDQTDNNDLYKELACLFLPSKKESFGNVILEAYSYGIPVISSVYAPGPAQLIEHGETGYLLEDFDVETIKHVLSLMDKKTLETLSKNAFEKHKDYRLDAYYDFIEGVGESAVSEFNGENLLPVYPKLTITTKFEETQKALAHIRQSTSFRLGHSIVKKMKIFMPSSKK